jgi:hypothetical protein
MQMVRHAKIHQVDVIARYQSLERLSDLLNPVFRSKTLGISKFP